MTSHIAEAYDDLMAGPASAPDPAPRPRQLYHIASKNAQAAGRKKSVLEDGRVLHNHVNNEIHLCHHTATEHSTSSGC